MAMQVRATGSKIRSGADDPVGSGPDPERDESLTADDGFLPVDEHGLHYPFSGQAPAPGALVQVAPGVRWTRSALGGLLDHINLWLIDDRDEHGPGVAVVDTGMARPSSVATWEAMLAGPLAGERITRVFATHFHPDHIGMAGWLGDRLGARLWMTREEWLSARLAGHAADERWEATLCRRWRLAGWDEAMITQMASENHGGFGMSMAPLAPDYVRIRDGDTIRFGDVAWQVVVGRGHSPEHGCLWNPVADVLISGDQILPRISSNVSVTASEPEGDPLRDWLESIDRLLELPEQTLVLPAHGEPFRGIRPRLTTLRTQHHEALDALAARLAEAPVRAVDSFVTLFKRPPEAFVGLNRELATGEALAHLRRLVASGRASMYMRDGVAWFSAGVD